MAIQNLLLCFTPRRFAPDLDEILVRPLAAVLGQEVACRRHEGTHSVVFHVAVGPGKTKEFFRETVGVQVQVEALGLQGPV